MIFVELFFIALFLTILLLALNLVSKKIVNYRTQKNADQILDKRFNGVPVATYRVSRNVGLRYGQVIAGAEKRGYNLHTQNKDTRKFTTLVFKKAV